MRDGRYGLLIRVVLTRVWGSIYMHAEHSTEAARQAGTRIDNPYDPRRGLEAPVQVRQLVSDFVQSIFT